jgi:enterochelin esterase family protein
VEEHRFPSVTLGNERRVWSYLPAGAGDGTEPLPVLVLLDGWEWAEAMPIAPTLDNLISEERIPPMAALLVESLDYLTRGRELPCQAPFPAFLADELLPWARSKWLITDEPARTIVAGQSYGGLAAAYASLTRPEVFGNAISQSGSFWWFEGWESAGRFDGDTSGWLVREVNERTPVPVRLWLEVGSFEYEEDRASNLAMRHALNAHGYDHSYREYEGGHSWLNWRGSIADALIDLTS